MKEKRDEGAERAAADFSAALLIIGDEILSGRTQDANLAYLATWLNTRGVQLREARVVPDGEAEIAAALNALRAKYRYVFTTGGIGPTHDDITVDSVAKAFGVPVIHHPEAVAMLDAFYKGDLNERRLRMARAPEGGHIIRNPMSGAPGIRMENVFMLAGIPAVMRAMLEGLDSEIQGGRPVLSRTIGVYAAESAIARDLEAIQSRNKDVMIGSYPVYREGRVGANLVLRSPDQARIDAVAEELKQCLKRAKLEAFDGEI